MYAAKLVYNENNFTQIGGLAQSGLLVNHPLGRNPYKIGFEEWLNSDFALKHKIGYLDCYRARMYNNITDLFLFMYNPDNKTISLIGLLKKVKQIQNHEIIQYRNIIENEGFINQVQDHFHELPDLRNINHNIDHEYWNCYNSDSIVEEPGQNFVFNIKYESIKIFNPNNRINLTDSFPDMNNKWKRLSIRYNIPDNILHHLQE